MRIERLDLLAWGHLTDCTLGFAPDGLTVVHGANEAGKTTTYHALVQLLYGIPHITPFDFAHAAGKLQIGARLRADDGTTHELIRRKGRSKTLSTPDGDDVAESVLGELLRNVDERTFTQVFCVRHEEIVAGGKALLADDGDMGAALAGAALGAIDLRGITSGLDSRLAELFLPGAAARNPEINAALRTVTASSKVLADAQVGSERYDELIARQHAAAVRLEACTAQVTALRERQVLLTRVRAAQPLIVQIEHHEAEMTACVDQGPVDRPEVADQLGELMDRRRGAEVDRAQLVTAEQRGAAALGELPAPGEILGATRQIAELGDLGVLVANDAEARVSLADRHKDTAADVEQRTALVPPALLDAHGRPSVTADVRTRVHALATSGVGVHEAHDAACAKLAEARAELDELGGKVTDADELPPRAPLGQALDRWQSLADREREVAERAILIDERRGDLEAVTVRLGLGAALQADTASDADVLEPHPLEVLVLPSAEAIEHAIGVHRDTAQRRVAAEATHTAAVEHHRAARRALDDLLEAFDTPSLDDLTDARTHRDDGWQLVRRHLDGADDVALAEAVGSWQGGTPLADAYEAAVVTADDVADRLRSEAEAVEHRRTLERQVADAAATVEQADDGVGEAGQAVEQAQQHWERLWSDLAVCPAPHEATAWHREALDAQRGAAELRKLAVRQRDDLAYLDDAARGLRAVLGDAASHLDERPSALREAVVERLGALERRYTEQQERRGALDRATERVHDREAVVATARRELDAWTEQWTAQLTTLSLPDDLEASEALAVLGALDDLTGAQQQLAKLDHTLVEIDGRAERLRTDVADLASRLLDGGADGPTATLLDRLVAASDDAKQREIQRTERERTLTDVRERLDEAIAALGGLDTELGLLAEQHGCVDLAELEALAARSVRHDQHRAERDALVTTVLEQTGCPLDQVRAEVGEHHSDTLASELEDLAAAEARAAAERDAAQSEAATLEEQRRSLGTGDELADLAATVEAGRAELVPLVEEYLQRVIARAVLREQVDEVRSGGVGPALEHAEVLYAKLTGGRYAGISVGHTDDGAHVAARTPGGDRVDVEHLSTGARDQLYLALRLGVLAHLCAERGPLPLVLDDVFSSFDDDRTRNGLAALAELADTTQVIVFTHHREVVEQAREVVPADRLAIAELPSPTGSTLFS